MIRSYRRAAAAQDRQYWWVTKMLIRGLFATPQGWPPDSPVWSSSMSSYRVIWSCHTSLTPKYRALIAESASSKRVHHLRSRAEIDAFIDRVGRERSGGPSSPPSRTTIR